MGLDDRITALAQAIGADIKAISAAVAATGGESGPAYTYTDGVLTRVDYDSGNYKLFTYGTGGLLAQVDYVVGAVTTRKTFFYNPDGSLASVTEVNL